MSAENVQEIESIDEVVTLVISWETQKVSCEDDGEQYLLTNEEGPGTIGLSKQMLKEAVPRLENAGIKVSGSVS